jgi:hypothetical protein
MEQNPDAVSIPRIRRLAGLASLCALLLCLMACGFFSLSAFPESASQIMARRDLSASISPVASGAFNLCSVTAGGSEFVLLFTDSPADPGSPHLLVMDPGLSILNSFSLNDLTPLAGSFFGRVALRDVNGLVAVGNVLFAPSPTGLAFSGTQGVGLFGPTLTVEPIDVFIEANFRTSAGLLQYDEYDSNWATTSTPSDFPLGTPAPVPSSPLRVAGVFTDPDSSTADIVLVFAADASRRHYFVPVTKNDVNLHFPSPFVSVFTSYPGYIVTSDLSSSSIGYSRDGMVAYNYRTGSLERFTLSNPGSAASISFGDWNEQMRLACQISGSSVYVWDPSHRTLTRYAKWW